ncbi:MAG: hypothetical protein ACOYT8_00540 [Candidatus Dependentiae bacterium]
MKKINIIDFLFILLNSTNALFYSKISYATNSVIQEDAYQQAQLNIEKRKIEKSLNECLKINLGSELSQLDLPIKCAEFVKDFILLHGTTELLKKMRSYQEMQKADLSNQE